ncbi:MAG: zeta toxin family protein [Candidatus Nomurabacteria bacterium]|jgi:predicted ATPase|nr:zeta toxin family protein [Candidatus Nomurabacteria bacterium]
MSSHTQLTSHAQLTSSGQLQSFVAQLDAYNRAHWGASDLPDEWRHYDYQAILQKVLADFTPNKTQNHHFLRIAGQSGSGKTTQLLPAADAYFAKRGLAPVIVAARLFVDYHPHLTEIKAEFPPEKLRELTNEFSVSLMFLTLAALIQQGYDIILDVTLLDPFIERTLMQLLAAHKYTSRIFLLAVSKTISDQFIAKRQGRVVNTATAEEFWHATHKALEFYGVEFHEIPITVWSAFDLQPIYNGPISNALTLVYKYQAINELPSTYPSEPELLAAKVATAQTL